MYPLQTNAAPKCWPKILPHFNGIQFAIDITLRLSKDGWSDEAGDWQMAQARAREVPSFMSLRRASVVKGQDVERLLRGVLRIFLGGPNTSRGEHTVGKRLLPLSFVDVRVWSHGRFAWTLVSQKSQVPVDHGPSRIPNDATEVTCAIRTQITEGDRTRARHHDVHVGFFHCSAVRSRASDPLCGTNWQNRGASFGAHVCLLLCKRHGSVCRSC